MKPIAVYGATGYTGKLVVAELVARGHEPVLAGRREDALRAVASEHGAAQVRVAAHDDPAALRAAFDGCGAVIAAAGPFMQLGEAVVRAAIDAGCHYVDTTGEQPFMRSVFDDHDAAARRAGVALVSGMGFDYLPGDLLCALAAEDLGPLSELTIAYAMAGFGATRGTMRSALLMLGARNVVRTDGALVPAGLAQPFNERFDFGAPLGVRRVANYPSGEVLSVPRHVDVRTLRSRITASTFGPAPLVPVLTPLTALLMRTPLRAALHRAIGRLPEGPPVAERRAARFTLVAEATPVAGGPPRRATLTGTDVYGLTAVTTVEGATRLIASTGLAGALAPAEAFDPRGFLDALAGHGVRYEVSAAPVAAGVS